MVQVEKNVYTNAKDEIAAIKSEKAMILMLLKMIGPAPSSSLLYRS